MAVSIGSPSESVFNLPVFGEGRAALRQQDYEYHKKAYKASPRHTKDTPDTFKASAEKRWEVVQSKRKSPTKSVLSSVVVVKTSVVTSTALTSPALPVSLSSTPSLSSSSPPLSIPLFVPKLLSPVAPTSLSSTPPSAPVSLSSTPPEVRLQGVKRRRDGGGEEVDKRALFRFRREEDSALVPTPTPTLAPTSTALLIPSLTPKLVLQLQPTPPAPVSVPTPEDSSVDELVNAFKNTDFLRARKKEKLQQTQSKMKMALKACSVVRSSVTIKDGVIVKVAPPEKGMDQPGAQLRGVAKPGFITGKAPALSFGPGLSWASK